MKGGHLHSWALIGVMGVMASIVGHWHAKVELFPHALSFQSPAPYSIQEEDPIIGHKTLTVYFQTELKEQSQYTDLELAITALGPGDSLVAHFSGYGGDVQTMYTLFNLIHDSKADTSAFIDGPSYSAFGILPFAFKHMHLAPQAFLMFHDIQVGKADRNTPDIHAAEFIYRNILTLYVAKYLTQAELDKILTTSGKGEVYIQSEDFNNRVAQGHA